MDSAFRIESPTDVRAMIARVVLGSDPGQPALGSIQLQPHQTSVIARLTTALRDTGGALLCDEVGMGKTFVALAVARRFQQRLVVAPASLETMWQDALERAHMTAAFVTYERLSRSDPEVSPPELLILDEAHHTRNPGTQRYQRIARLARGAAVLMLTATPVHNRRADLVALLSLFLGSRAGALTERELAACVVRRERETEGIVGLPAIMPMVEFDVPDDPTVVAELMNFPPPLPARDAGSAGALINRGLVHQWASSEAALVSALRRRLTRAMALIASLEAGRYPSAAELAVWTIVDGAVQLGFAELLAPPTADAAALLASIAAHANALEKLLDRCRTTSLIDEVRTGCLRRIREDCPGAKIVAFAQYSATISALYRRLANSSRVAMLTASGAQVAGGRLSRQDAIERFAPLANRSHPPSRAEVIDLLLATDLLSEGVNLQDAEVGVHLDFPWTAARMEQRVGRVARMHSSHSRIRVYQLGSPPSAERVLRGHFLLETKLELARTLVGANVSSISSDLVHQSTSSIPSRVERLRTILSQWLRVGSNPIRDAQIFAAAVTAGDSGFIAAGDLGDFPAILCCIGNRVSTDLDAQIAACILAQGESVDADSADYDRARRAIREWADCSQASESAGVAVAPPARRKRLLNRIDAALQNAPPHVRASRAAIAAKARMIASSSHGAILEQELEAFTSSPLPDDDWLSALANLDVPRQLSQNPDGAGFRLRALLLFRP